MKAFALTLILVLLNITALFSQTDEYPLSESCTSIMAGSNATTDGSVITSHTCDGRYRSWLNIVPAARYEDKTMMEIQWGTMMTETPWDTRGVEAKGKIDYCLM